MSKPEMDMKIKHWLETVNGAYKGTVVERAARLAALKLLRFSSGCVKLDLALGGGWPFSRVAIIAGEYSTGKTLLALKAAESVQKYCHNCHRFGGLNVGGTIQYQLCNCKNFTPGACLFVDLEGSFDLDWAVANGWDKEWHCVARPETAEQAIDTIDSAIRANVFDLIVIDSIAAMTPSKEIEASVEEWQMGLAARLVNKAMRKWNAALNKMSQDNGSGGPLVLCLNQIRMKIGLVMGDPRTLPGGKGQEFNSSIIVYTKSPELTAEETSKSEEDDKKKQTMWGTYKGVTKKNKTYVPKIDYEFDMALRDIKEEGTLGIKKGEIDNPIQLLKEGKRYGLVKKIGDGIGFGSVVVASEKALLSQFKAKPEVRLQLWRALMKEACDMDTV